MKKLILILALFLPALAFAQTGITTITASKINNAGTQPLTGQLCATPAEPFVAYGGGNVPATQVCYTVTNGVLQSGALLYDVSLSNPANVCYQIVLKNSYGQTIQGWPCMQPSGPVYSFDNFVQANPPFTATSFTIQPTLSFLGAWSSTQAYNPNNVAVYNGNSYVALLPNSDAEPDISPSDWAFMAGGGASLPFPGIVYGTSATGGTVATSAQIASAINLNPTVPLVTPIYANTYLFSVLNNNATLGPETWTSLDGINIQPLTKANNADIVTDSNNFRDPRLLHAGNTYYYSYTTNSTHNGIGLVSSTDMQNWTAVTTPDWSAYGTAVWNGAWWVSGGTTYMFVGMLGSNTTYYATFDPATNTFGTPTPITFSPVPEGTDAFPIVMAIWTSAGENWALLQVFDSTVNQHYVELATFTSLSGTWSIVGSGNWAGWGTSIEGGEIRINPDGTLTAYFTDFGGGNLYYSNSSTSDPQTATWSARATISPYGGARPADWVDVQPVADTQTNQNLIALQRATNSKNGLESSQGIAANGTYGYLYWNGQVGGQLSGLLPQSNHGVVDMCCSPGESRFLGYGPNTSTPGSFQWVNTSSDTSVYTPIFNTVGNTLNVLVPQINSNSIQAPTVSATTSVTTPSLTDTGLSTVNDCVLVGTGGLLTEGSCSAAALPTATAAGQFLASSGAGTTYGIATSAQIATALSATPQPITGTTLTANDDVIVNNPNAAPNSTNSLLLAQFANNAGAGTLSNGLTLYSGFNDLYAYAYNQYATAALFSINPSWSGSLASIYWGVECISNASPPNIANVGGCFSSNGANINVTQNGASGNTAFNVSGTMSASVSMTTPIVNNTAAQTSVTCATSGTAVFSMPEQGASYKKVIVYENACIGAASYTFPTAFTYAPQVLSQAEAATATTVSATAVTVTGVASPGSTGFLELDGY